MFALNRLLVPTDFSTHARRALARVATELEVSRMLQRRVISEALKDGVPTVELAPYLAETA